MNMKKLTWFFLFWGWPEVGSPWILGSLITTFCPIVCCPTLWMPTFLAQLQEDLALPTRMTCIPPGPRIAIENKNFTASIKWCVTKWWFAKNCDCKTWDVHTSKTSNKKTHVSRFEVVLGSKISICQLKPAQARWSGASGTASFQSNQKCSQWNPPNG